MQFKQIFLTYLLININKLTISIKLLLKIIKFTKNNNSSRFFGSNFDFNSRNRLELNRVSIPTLEIDSPRLSSRINSNCQDLSRLIDSNSINRPNAINLYPNRIEKII